MTIVYNKSIWMYVLLFAVFIVGSLGLNADPIYGGEYHSIRHTGIFDDFTSVSQVFLSVQETSPQHAPFYFVILAYWGRGVGINPLALRALSLLGLLLGIAASYRTGKLLFGSLGGFFSAFFVSVSAFAIFYSHEIRMYAFMPFLSAAIIGFYWSMLSAKNQVRWYQGLGLFLSSSLAIYTHYASIFVLIAMGVYHLLFVAKNRRWLQITLIEICAGISFLFWFPVFLNGNDSRISLANSSLSFFEVIYHNFFLYSNGLWMLAIALLVLAFVSLRFRRPQYRFVLLVGLLSLILISAVNEVSPILPLRRMRYTLIWLSPLAFILSLGLLQLWNLHWRIARLIVSGVLVLWCGAFIWFSTSEDLQNYSNRDSYHFDQYPPFHIFQPYLDKLPGYGTPVITAHPTVDVELPVLEFYSKWTGREFSHIFNETDPEWIPLMIHRLDLLEDDESFMLAYDPRTTNPEEIDLYKNIIEEFKFCKTVLDLPDAHLDYYVRHHIPCNLIDDSLLLNLEFENEFILNNIVFERVDENHYLVFSWWDGDFVDEMLPLGFTLQLLDSQNQIVLSSDYYMPNKTIGFNDLDVSELLEGTYSIEFKMWSAETGAVIRSHQKSSNAEFVESSVLGEIKLENDLDEN